MADNQDNPGSTFTPPLIYLLPLISWACYSIEGRTSPPCHATWREVWGRLFSEALLSRWFFKSMRDAEAPLRTDTVPRLTTEGPFRYTRNPGYLCLAMFYAVIAVLSK